MGLHLDHVPLVCGLPWRRFYPPKPATGLSKRLRLQLQHHWEMQTYDWNQLVLHATQQLQALDPRRPDLDGLNSLLMQSSLSFRPSRQPVQECLQSKWAWTSSTPRR